jgi:hypothetical protein
MCRGGIHGQRGTLPLGCMSSGADETPSSHQNDYIRHTVISPWFRPREGISRKTLHLACLIPYRWKGTTVEIQLAGDLEATSLSRRTWPLLRRKSLCPSCPLGEEQELVFFHFLYWSRKFRSSRTLARSSFYVSRGYHSDWDTHKTSVKRLLAVAWPGGCNIPSFQI